ncbi:Cilia- and flagella-associated protein 251 [Anthophora plagiata]
MDSNASTSSSSEESVDSKNRERSKEKCKKEEYESNLCPFKLLWSFGINPEVPVINLTTENRSIIAYACSHAVFIYNYETKESINLQGHQNAVKTLSISKDGKWLLSADFDKDPVIVVWDTESGTPISTLFNPHGEKEMTAAKISPNAKYIVTVGNEIYQKVYLWLWTYGKDKPDASAELTEIVSDRVKEIAFNENFPEEFVLTAEYDVVFFKWEEEELKHYYEHILGNVRRYGIFNCSCYIPNTQRVLTATTNGYVLVWDDVPTKDYKSKDKIKVYTGRRKHIKSVKFQKSSITVILYHNRMIVLGTSEGRINFYDINFKILYWCHNNHFSSIRSISFDLPSTLLGPASVVSAFEFEFDEDDNFGYEGESEQYLETKLENDMCEEKLGYLQRIELVKEFDEISLTPSVYLEEMFRNHDKNQEGFVKPPHIPTDATLDNAPFHVGKFFISCSCGTVASIDIPVLKCRFIFQNMSAPITSLDVHPQSNFIAVGNALGFVTLYDYEKQKVIIRKKAPPLPNLHVILDDQVRNGTIVYVTCPQSHEKLIAVSLLKYSPTADLLACGLQNGTLWMLHPITLEPLDKNPYKHSTESILKLAFTECGEYMAYADNTLVVAVFKRNYNLLSGTNVWDFLGKYRSHHAPIKGLLFCPATTNSVVSRLFSLGVDQYLIEYDLKDSGPYPFPGLKILESHKIECNATPLCLASYPELGVEGFLIISNSEYKYRLLNDITKTVRGTFLGPLYGSPVKHFKVLPGKEYKKGRYMIFATEKEIGLQILPFDGNPYKILGMVGHPRKITNICTNSEGNILFTTGYNDPCVLIWKIKSRSVDVLAHLGGKGLSPYYCLIEGGKKGWLIHEMKDLFYYAQILHQGENTTAPRIISETVSTKQIPNLMRAIGYYPSNEEIEIFMGEVSYRNYAETGYLVDDITFEDFVKLYINHRPAFGISLHQLQEAFQIFTNPNRIPTLELGNPVMTRDLFMRILFGEGPPGFSKGDDMPFGEPLTIQEAFIYLKLLIGFDQDLDEAHDHHHERKSESIDFTFLPERISYKDFTANIMGIELLEETRADGD